MRTSLPMLFVMAFLPTLLVGLLTPTSSTADEEMVDKIVAVVNEDPITYQDLVERLAFTAKNIQQELTKRQKQNLLQAQLDELIEEQLLLQYAKERNYNVPPEEIEKAIETIENRNKQKAGSFLAFAGEQAQTARQKVKVSVLRNMIASRELRPRVAISDTEINRVIDSVIAQTEESGEKEIAQIFIPVTDDDNEVEFRNTIQRIHSQLTSGASFNSLAKAYSRDENASDGGYLGWFRRGELASSIDKAIQGLGKEDISEPVRSPNGWHIFKVLDTRKAPKPDLKPVTELNLLQLYAPADTTAGTPTKLQNEKRAEEFKKLAEDIDNREDFIDLIDEKKEASALYTASGDMGWIALDSLDTALAEALKEAQPNSIVGPVSAQNGVYLFYVADKRTRESNAVANLRERITQRMTDRRTGLALRRLIRNLRRKAFIEVRL